MRTVLYANKKVAQILRNNFVLHWKSVRPVPRITIDFGDGRIVKRTITGNAVHYILDAKGQLIDAIPGLYAAKAFSRTIQAGYKIFHQLKHSHNNRQSILVRYHSQRLQTIYKNWKQDLALVGIEPITSFSSQTISSALPLAPMTIKPITSSGSQRRLRPRKTAQSAILRARGKGVIELPMLQLFPNTKPLARKMSGKSWKSLAQLHARNVHLDANSRKLIAYQNPKAALASLLTVSKAKVENPMLRMIRNFEKSLAVDTIRNEYEFHSQIHMWFCQGIGKQSLENFNKKVYAEIFLTPMTDPWLGLKENLYTGLKNNGLLDS